MGLKTLGRSILSTSCTIVQAKYWIGVLCVNVTRHVKFLSGEIYIVLDEESQLQQFRLLELGMEEEEREATFMRLC